MNWPGDSCCRFVIKAPICTSATIGADQNQKLTVLDREIQSLQYPVGPIGLSNSLYIDACHVPSNLMNIPQDSGRTSEIMVRSSILRHKFRH